jgi:hypothetical protein
LTGSINVAAGTDRGAFKPTITDDNTLCEWPKRSEKPSCAGTDAETRHVAAQESIVISAIYDDHAAVHAAFAHLVLPNKQAMAEVIAKYISAFERYVPPRVKAWMTEDSRMGIFDAAALALVFYQKADHNL